MYGTGSVNEHNVSSLTQPRAPAEFFPGVDK